MWFLVLAVLEVSPKRLKRKEVPSATREIHDKVFVLDEIHTVKRKIISLQIHWLEKKNYKDFNVSEYVA